MRYLFAVLFALGIGTYTFAQSDTTKILAKNDLEQIKILEDTIQVLSYHVLRSRVEEERNYACQELIKTLVAALKFDNSFYYPFDSVRHISIMYPEDSSFRIFTWQLYVSENDYKYFGAIQVAGKKLKLFPLSDRSELMPNPENEIVSSRQWYGALYYNIKQINTPSGKYYTLFGLDYYKMMSRRKVIDVLHFDEDGEPQFGAPIFTSKDAKTGEDLTKNRVVLEYSAQGAVYCNFNAEYNLIIFDNLIDIPPAYKDQGMMSVSDGSYRGYKFDGSKWVFIEKVFNDFQENAPRDKPVLDKRKDGLFGPGKRKN